MTAEGYVGATIAATLLVLVLAGLIPWPLFRRARWLRRWLRIDAPSNPIDATEDNEPEERPEGVCEIAVPDGEPPPDEPIVLERAILDGSRLDRGRLILEAVVSAGPRKSLADYEATIGATELCEDSTGFLTSSELTGFWVCDGASDGPLIGGLTNRALARSLGRHLAIRAIERLTTAERRWPGDGPRTTDLESFADTWQKQLAQVMWRLSKGGTDFAFLEQLPMVGASTWQVVWSTTLVLGVLHESRRELLLVNCGDSGGVVFGPSVTVIRPNPRRISLVGRLSFNGSGALETNVEIIGADRAIQPLLFARVEGFLALTDGASPRGMDQFLQRVGKAGTEDSLEKLRPALLSISERSYDDKAMLLGYWVSGAQ